jgi:hypothetical protein
MREWPEVNVVRRRLAEAGRRRRLGAVLRAVAAGLGAAIPVAVILHLVGMSTAMVGITIGGILLVAMTIAHFQFVRTTAAVAAAVEARAPECRNLLVTADALMQTANADAGRLQAATPEGVRRIVLHDAAAVVSQLDMPRLFPLRPMAGRAALLAAGLAATFLLRTSTVERLLPTLVTQASSTPTVADVQITVTPPAYAQLPALSLDNPERVTAVVGSRVELSVSGQADHLVVATTSSRQEIAAVDGRFSATLELAGDGFLSVTPVDAAGTAGARRLIGLTATPDRSPVPKVVSPGKDMFLREAGGDVALSVEATDDLGLRALRLAYTKVAGVGESFTFTEGEVPLDITRMSSRQWAATGTLPLASMALDVGDMVVYRAVAQDGRPGAPAVESDSFIVEIVSESQAMAEGFSIDDTQDKYALSQQMVIVKTERLIAKAASRQPPTADALLEEALMIAAEQRSVRAELVFMMGGHFEDEFAEAEHEHEIAEGRLDNSGRADLGRAIRDMSRASAELTEVNLKVALEAEKAALAAMQRALSRRRFILRTLTQRDAIDDARRLSGSLTDAAQSRRASAVEEVPAHIVAVRAALVQLQTITAPGAPLASGDADIVAAVVDRLLPHAGVDSRLVDIIGALSRAGESVAAERLAQARTDLTTATTGMSSLLESESVTSIGAADAEARRLKGALADIQRRGGGGQ